MSEMIERVARALAERHGDKWDDLPRDKSHWTEQRGQFGGRFRDVNERFRCDYLDEAEAAIEAMRLIPERYMHSLVRTFNLQDDETHRQAGRRWFEAMIDSALQRCP